MSYDPAPLDLTEVLDPDWLSFALGSTSAAGIPGPPVRVGTVEVVETIVTMATKVRLRLDYESAPDNLPRAVCVKGYFGGDHPVGRTRNAVAEARFYTEVGPSIDVRLPRALYAGTNPDTVHGLLVMEDLVVRGATFLDALSPFTPDQTSDSLEQLAIVHAATWDGRGLDHLRWLTPRMTQMVEHPSVSAERIDELFDEERGRTLPSSLKVGRRIEAAVRSLGSVLAPLRGQCLVHGDAHAGNSYTLDGRQGVVDWQVVQRNHWAVDVAYHIASTLTVAQRRAHEDDLLLGYLDALTARGVDAPRRDDAHLAYRAAMAYGYYLWCITQRVARPITNELVHRLGSAVDDLETFELIERT